MKANLKLKVTRETQKGNRVFLSVVFFMVYLTGVSLIGCAGVNEDEDNDNIPRVSPTTVSFKSSGDKKSQILPSVAMKNKIVSVQSEEDGETVYSSTEEEYGNQLPIIEVMDASLDENQLFYLVDYDSRYIPEISVNLLNSAFFEYDGFTYKRDDSDIMIECADKDNLQDLEENYASDSEIVRVVSASIDTISFQSLENGPGEVNVHLLLKYIALEDPEMAILLQVRIKVIVSDKLRPRWVVFNDDLYDNSRLFSANPVNSFGVIFFTIATDENTNLTTTNKTNVHIPESIPIRYEVVDMRSGVTIIDQTITNVNTYSFSDATIYGHFSCYLAQGLYQIKIKAPPDFYDLFETSYLVEITK